MNELLLIDATAARAISQDITNEEVAKCLKNIMSNIITTAKKGGIELTYSIDIENKPKGFCELVVKTLKSLGYEMTYKSRTTSAGKELWYTYLISW